MIPVTQTKFGKGEGNCLAAAVASILEVPLWTVPDLAQYGDGMFGYLAVWLRDQHKIGMVMVDGQEAENTIVMMPPCYHLIGGLNHDGVGHAVVGYQGKIVWDPNPNRRGLNRILDYTFFVKHELQR